MPPFLMMAVRSLLAGAILVAWASLREGDRATRRQWASAAVVGVVLFLGCHGLLAWAQQTVPSGIAALVLATIPVWMTLLDWAAGGARPNARSVAGLALGLLGLTILIAPGARGAHGASATGLAVLVASAFAWAAGSILARRVGLPSGLVLASGIQLLAGGAALTIVGLALGETRRLGPAMFAPRPMLAFAYMIGISSLLCFTAYMWLLRVSTPARVGSYAFVNPVVALFVGWAFGGEGLHARTLAASLVVVTGVALIVLSRNPKKGAVHAHVPEEPILEPDRSR